MMSHEFRTPLGTALMLLDAVLTMIKEAQAIKLIQLTKSSLNLLLSLVDDIVDLKAIKENEFTIKKSVFNPYQAFDFIRQLLS